MEEEMGDTYNKDTIYDLVKRYFWLDNDSLKLFKERLYEPFVDPIYKDILEEDYRKVWKVPKEILEEYDEGWALFKIIFKVFIHDENVIYENFRNNKILKDKNNIKIKKVLKNYYMENYKKNLVMENDLRLFSVKNLSQEDTREKLIDDFIKNSFERIGKVKLPNSGLNIVLSLNFEDWFFCSSGESWGSCLNFSSEYMYWAGLVGLVGDRNRAMLYVTDGKKKNPFKEIKVDRLLSRSWTLLNQKDNINNVVQFYPNSYFSREAINKITEKNFVYDHWNSFESKYPIEPIYFNNGNNAFIYQDTTEINSNHHLYGGRKGFYYFNKNNPSMIEQGDIFLHKDDGLFDLIDEGTNLGNCEIQVQYCSICDGSIYEEDTIYEHQGKIYCSSCFEENFFYCEICGEIESLDNAIEVNSIGLICNTCFEQNFFNCDKCGENHHIDDLFTVIENEQELNICNECFEKEEYEECQECNNFHKKEELIEDEYGKFYCNNCLKEIREKKQNCFIFNEEVA
jgi:hypothetical protein